MKQFKARLSALAMVMLCGLAASPACAATAQAQQTAPGNEVELAAQFPHDVTIGKMAATGGSHVLTETIRLTLTNNSTASVTLKKANDCQTHIWTITDSTGQTIDDRAMCMMIYMPVTQTIAPHGKFAATQSVTLDGSKYQDSGQYTLHYTFWGVTANLNFTVHVVQ